MARMDGPDSSERTPLGFRMVAALVAVVAFAALAAVLAAGCQGTDTASPAPPVPRPSPAPASIDFVVTQCGDFRGTGITDSGVQGTVTNNGTIPVDIFIETDFLSGVFNRIVYQGNPWVRSLAPGRTARWESLSIEFFNRCEARVANVFES